ncbi:MAG: RluA family pseudouridine synthase [Planctomycetes bacterium]|nr:RluA family pseudouridine synthase [Planctomycetota bacterium]
MAKVPVHLYDSLDMKDLVIQIRSRPVVERVDRHLVHRLGYLSRNYIQKLIREGNVKVNGAVVRPSHRLQAGDRVELCVPVIPERVIEPEAVSLTILYEDADILVIDKPANLSCHAGRKIHGGTLANAIIFHVHGAEKDAGTQNPGIVHRLDKNTSGVMVLAKTKDAHQALSGQFALGHVQKEYLAVVKGSPERHRGVIDAPIGRHPWRKGVMSVRPDALHRRPSVTHYRVVERFRHGSVLSCMPKTGRTHQIRVHLESFGHPLFGDERYPGSYSWSGFDGSLGRQALHAWRLTLAHPATDAEMKFEAGLPSDMAKLIHLLRQDTPDAPVET